MILKHIGLLKTNESRTNPLNGKCEVHLQTVTVRSRLVFVLFQQCVEVMIVLTLGQYLPE